MRKFFTALVFLLAISFQCRSQFIDSTKGLLIMPSAEMEKDGVFMISNTFLNKSYLENPVGNPYRWGYDSFSYGFGITFWSRLEIDYVLTLFIGKWSPYANSHRSISMRNQDRHFAARFQLVKENEFGMSWIPSIVIGTSDPVTGGGGDGDYIDGNVKTVGNGFFNKYYVAASKHFNTGWGIVGAHAAYQMSKRKYIVPHGPQFGVTWDPVWLNNPSSFLSATRLIAEYDGKEVNVGATASIWKDHFEFWTCLQACRYFNGGVRFKVILAGAD